MRRNIRITAEEKSIIGMDKKLENYIKSKIPLMLFINYDVGQEGFKELTWYVNNK